MLAHLANIYKKNWPFTASLVENRLDMLGKNKNAPKIHRLQPKSLQVNHQAMTWFHRYKHKLDLNVVDVGIVWFQL
jgi:hypothetical protein